LLFQGLKAVQKHVDELVNMVDVLHPGTMYPGLFDAFDSTVGKYRRRFKEQATDV
jgi:hypothetical protein